jgi:hypothetical protein
MVGIVRQKDPNAEFPSGTITQEQMFMLNQQFTLHQHCGDALSFDESNGCTQVGHIYCTSANRPLLTTMVTNQENMMALEESGECNFGIFDSMNSEGTCGMLNLKPSKMMYFLCGTTQVETESLYCGDWVSNPDGQCASDRFSESCSLANGPVRINESECADNAFLEKFVRGSDDNPYCGPLLRGGCCVASMFFALTDSDEQSLWPLCVRTWASQTCGVDLSSPCTNDEVVETLVVEVELVITSVRRLSDDTSSLCTNKGAELLSKRLSAALNKTSSEAQGAGARTVVISDSACLGLADSSSRTVVADFVLQADVGSAVDNSVVESHMLTVSDAVRSSGFQANLKAEGVDTSNINVKTHGKSATTNGNVSSNSTQMVTLAPGATTAAPTSNSHRSTCMLALATSVTAIFAAVM